MSGTLAGLLVDALSARRARLAAADGEVWDSAAILALARRSAAALAAAGVQPAEPVHLTIANRPADLGALLGVWLAGAVAVPVHRAAPAAASDRLRRTTGARFALDAGALAVIADLYRLTETGSCDFCLGPADRPQGAGTIGAPTEQVAPSGWRRRMARWRPWGRPASCRSRLPSGCRATSTTRRSPRPRSAPAS